jgi:hypothetical protein
MCAHRSMSASERTEDYKKTVHVFNFLTVIFVISPPEMVRNFLLRTVTESNERFSYCVINKCNIHPPPTDCYSVKPYRALVSPGGSRRCADLALLVAAYRLLCAPCLARKRSACSVFFCILTTRTTNFPAVGPELILFQLKLSPTLITYFLGSILILSSHFLLL